MREQLHVARFGLISEDNFRPVKNKPRLMRKPAMSGMWTSTFDPSEDHMSDWIRYCTNENDLLTGVRHVQILKPKKEARILELDLHVLKNVIYKKYMMEPVMLQTEFLGEWNMLEHEIDFEKLSQDYDAIHYVPGCLTIGLDIMDAMDVRFNNPFTAWDCESTLWFRWMFEDNVIVKKVKFPPREELDDDWWDTLGEE